MRKPVLANGRCDVLEGQCIRNNGRPTNGLSDRDVSIAGRTRNPLTAADRSVIADRACAHHDATATVSSMAIAVHQVLASLGYGDAIGHEVLGIQRVLRAAGYESEIFVEATDPRLEDITRDYLGLPATSHPDNILIHHFSIGSRASRVAYALPDRMMLVYHNITPPEYFIGIHPVLVQQCYLGRRELAFYASRCDLALGDSEYNRRELEAAGFPRTDVLPVIPGFSHLAGPPDDVNAKWFDDHWVNLLFVGRIIPSKRIEDLIRWFHAYKKWFNPRSRLLLVGSHGGFENYVATLYDFINRLGVADVYLQGHVSNEELVAYYEIADIFVCASEHEGFCVPLMEAFHMGIPVVAYAAAAVPSTMDGGGVLVDTKDPSVVAGVIDALVTNTALQDRVLANQNAALARLAARDFDGTLLRFIDQVQHAPRLPHPPVAPDFWEQVSQAEQLAQIRIHRPGAFMALATHEAGEGHEESR